MTEIVSLEAKLTEHWQETLETGRKMVENAEYNLGRIAVIYSDQLDFDKYAQDLAME